MLPKTFGPACIYLAASLSAAMNYPVAPKGEQVDNYHGRQIADPYRGLEDASSPATQKWVEEENAFTQSYLSKLPGHDTIHSRLTELWNFERFSNAYQVRGRFFDSQNSGLQNQDVVYVTDPNGAPRVLLDPNTLRKDGTAALNGESVSWNGKLFAYAIAQAGSDWSEWRVRDIDTGKDLPDVINWVKVTSLAWAHDDSGFYYSRFPEPPSDAVLTAAARNSKIYFHKLGDPESADKLIYERPDQPVWILSAQVTEDGRYLVLYVSPGDFGKNMLFYRDLANPDAKVVELISKEEYSYTFVGSVENRFYLHTTDGASRGRLIEIDLDHPEKARWKEIVPEQPATLNSVAMANNKFLLDYLQDAHSVARLFSLEGKHLNDVELPGLGTASLSSVRQSDREIYYSFVTFTSPAAIYRLDLATGNSKFVVGSKLSFSPASYETKQVFYHSKDGTSVPMFLTYRKGIELNGQNPTLLYGYGGFNVAVTPSFNPPYIAWMDMGGIFAVANLRGGSEYGEAWHLAGTKEHKQNVFNDFIGAAEWLIANKYTSTPKLSIFGGSNGGLLVGAVVNQRPDLFGAAMAAVGVMDMLRFQKFGFGALWAGDYGSSDDAKDFENLVKYSPLHNIKPGTHYPAILITTSDHDDRVMPGHSFKYAATLQQAQAGAAPILIRIETRAGHGAGKPVSKLIDEWTDRLVFLRSALAMN